MTEAARAIAPDDFPAFRPDEPVLQQHPLIKGVPVPAFSDQSWDLGAVDAAANIPPHNKIIRFDRFTRPGWNHQARVIVMASLNPTHAAVRKAGVHRSAVRGTNIRTAVTLAQALGELHDWDSEWPAATDPEEIRWWGRRYVESLSDGRPPADNKRLKRAKAVRSFYIYRNLLADSGLEWDAFDDLPLPTALSLVTQDSCTGPLVPKETYWPLLRAAWAYIDVFSDDILQARDEWDQLQSRPPSGIRPSVVLADWQKDPEALVPLHTNAGNGRTVSDPNWRMLSRWLGLRESTLGQKQGATVRSAREHALRLVEQGRYVVGGLAEPLATVERLDGTAGPWSKGLDGQTIREELTALRAAAYIFIAAVAGMRDSEIQELERGCLQQTHSGPVLRSRVWKLSNGRPATWAVIDPVARVIDVLERLSRHDSHLFVAAFERLGSTRRAGFDANNDIEVFVDHVNETAGQSGLACIPDRTTTHAFRHTFAVIAADEPWAEVAVGWQMKHAANRILTTQAHLDREGTGWDKDIATEQTRAAIEVLYDSFTGYLDGGTIAGGGAARRRAFFEGVADEVAERFPGQTGDDEIIKPFLRSLAETYYPGTLNDCAFDASLARCISSTADTTPVIAACQPGRCPNATIEEKHRPVWVSARGRLADLLGGKKLSEPKRALLNAELAELDRTIATIEEANAER